MLDCIWAEPTLMGNSDLQRRVVGFDDLTLERERQRAYYFDFDGARDALQEQAQNENDNVLPRYGRSSRPGGSTTKRATRRTIVAGLSYGGHWRLKGLNFLNTQTMYPAHC